VPFALVTGAIGAFAGVIYEGSKSTLAGKFNHFGSGKAILIEAIH